jgi:hypothetical protein
MFKHHINVFLPRIWKSYKYYKSQDENYSWDNLFSHAVSHEYMHKALMELEGIEASSWLDKLPEIYKLNRRELVRSGIPIKEE